MKKCIVLYLLVTTAIGNMYTQSPLCPSTATSFCCEYIESVTINGVTYAGATSFSSGPGYFDYTNTSLTNLVAGNTYPVSIVVHTNSTYQEYLKIWFDFNGNGDLSDPGEIIFDENHAFSGTFNFTGNFTVPTDAFNGDIYLRVMMVFSAAPELCGNYNYGNTLDFKANISNGINAETLTVTTPDTNGTGHVISSNSGIDTANGIHSANYSINSLVTLTATANGTDSFTGWSGDATGTDNPLEVTMDASKNIIANFGPTNASPTVSNLSNLSECPGTETVGPLSFTVSDTESDPSNLTITAISSNLTLLQNSNISIGGTDENRTITLTPEIGQTGATTITIEVLDESGAFTATSFVLSLEDSIPPIVIPIGDFDENLNNNCEFSIPDYTALTTVTDNCGTPTISQIPAVGTIISGHNTVQTITLTADDANGNTNSTSFNINLIDNTVPTLSEVTDFDENLNNNCEFNIPDYTALTTVTDNCGTPTITQIPAVGTIISGHNTVQTITLTADDANGNTNTTSFNINLIDNTVPTLSEVTDFDENLNNNCEFSIPDYTALTTATDNCSTPTITQIPVVGTIISGHNTVQTITLTADDANGNTNSTSFNINLIDNTVPTLSEVTDFDENLNNNCEFSIPDYTALTTVTDNCGTPTITQIPAVGTIISGHNTVQTITLTADDANGNTNTTSFNINLIDNTVPTLSEVTDFGENLNNNCEFSIPDYTALTTVNDNCGTPTISQIPAVGTIISGHNTVQTITLTADDANGNTNTTSFNINLIDNTVPTLSEVTDFDENLNNNCEFNIPDYTALTTVTDNCGTPTITQIPAVGTIISGHNTVQTITLTADDANGNTNSTSFNINLIDNTVPTLSEVTDFDENLNNNCEFSIPDYTALTTATDNCSTPTISQIPAVGTIISGHNTVQTITLTADDANGNTNTTSFNINLIDNTVPTLSEVTDFDENLNNNCEFNIPDYTALTTVTDNCGTPTITQIPAVGTIISGHNTVQTITLTADDANGNTNSTSFNINLIDNTVPTLSEVTDFDENLNNNCEFSIPDYTALTTATDNCSTPTISQIPVVGTIISGHNTVQTITLTADDANGNTNTTSFNINLIDSIAPTAITQDITVQLSTEGLATITTNLIDNSSTDNCGIDSYNLDVTDFTCSDIGQNTVTLTVIDINGNSNSETAIVTVEDDFSPTVITQNITVQIGENGMVTITPEQINNLSTDNCGIASYNLDIDTFSCENLGENTVTLTVTDVNDNISEATAIVTVQDSIVPIALAIEPFTVEIDELGSTVVMTAETIDNGSNDNCFIATMSIDQDTFTCDNLGENTVILTVTDLNGNSASTTTVITVVDLTAPIIVTQDIILQLDDNGEASVTPNEFIADSFDNCSIAILSVDRTNFNCAQLGEYVVNISATDTNGNTTTEAAIVTVTGDDNDGDLISDACDPDDDNDGVLDDDDAFPFDSTPFLVPAEAITPNGDNINDFWIIPGINNYPNARIHVYNRWGHEVFRTKNYKNDWNGVYKSEKLPSGSYLYTIDLGGDSKEALQGWIFINY